MTPKEARQAVPEPMKIIREREKEVLSLPPHRIPMIEARHIHEAASAYAAWDNSDPFAYARMHLYASHGLVSAMQTGAEFRSKVRVRQLATHAANTKMQERLAK